MDDVWYPYENVGLHDLATQVYCAYMDLYRSTKEKYYGDNNLPFYNTYTPCPLLSLNYDAIFESYVIDQVRSWDDVCLPFLNINTIQSKNGRIKSYLLQLQISKMEGLNRKILVISVVVGVVNTLSLYKTSQFSKIVHKLTGLHAAEHQIECYRLNNHPALRKAVEFQKIYQSYEVVD